MDEKTRAVVEVISALGFVGNTHYCPGCMNEFHADRGQHDQGCPILAEVKDDDGWWHWVEEHVNG